MDLVHTRAELATARDALAGSVAVVMTMGALHSGHQELLRAAARDADHLIVTVFVNPLQFGPTEDFDRYPRTLAADLEMCRAAGASLVFAPSAAEMYPGGEPEVRVDPGPLGARWEGASRPGFFHGVSTVVLKLLHLTRPHRAYFGEKDYQQLTVIRRMVTDLDLPVEIVGVPTVREADGLALSSRNRYLSETERGAALALSSALRAGAKAAERGGDPMTVLAAAYSAFAAAGNDVVAAKLDYLVLTDPELRRACGDFGSAGQASRLDPEPALAAGPARLLVAAWVGATRLIDNAPLTLTFSSTTTTVK